MDEILELHPRRMPGAAKQLTHGTKPSPVGTEKPQNRRVVGACPGGRRRAADGNVKRTQEALEMGTRAAPPRRCRNVRPTVRSPLHASIYVYAVVWVAVDGVRGFKTISDVQLDQSRHSKTPSLAGERDKPPLLHGLDELQQV